MTLGQFAAKVEWEGGVIEALRYGLKSSDLSVDDDPDAQRLLDVWSALEGLWTGLAQLEFEAEEILERSLDALDDQEV